MSESKSQRAEIKFKPYSILTAYLIAGITLVVRIGLGRYNGQEQNKKNIIKYNRAEWGVPVRH